MFVGRGVGVVVGVFVVLAAFEGTFGISSYVYEPAGLLAEGPASGHGGRQPRR